MKSIYEVTDHRGIHLCYQVAKTEAEALSTARMYGHRSAAKAKFVQRDN